MDQVLSGLGAVMILSAFAAHQYGKLATTSSTYLWLNFVGSGLLAGVAASEGLWAFVVLNTVWALVSLRSLWRLARGERVGA